MTEAQLDVGRDAVARLRQQLGALTDEGVALVHVEASAIRVGDVDYGGWLVARTAKALAGQEIERRKGQHPDEVRAE